MAGSDKFRRGRSKQGAAEISEFALVMYVLFIFLLVPLIDLVALFAGAAIQYLATNDIASKAATQADYSGALNSMFTEANQFESFGLAKFLHLEPNGGFTGCGNDLYVLTTAPTGTVLASQPDQPPDLPSSSANFYEMSVRSTYNLSPLVSFSGIPLLGQVPGLGQPVSLSFSANRPVEHPSGLSTGSGSTSGTGGSGPVTPFSRIIASNPVTPVPPGTNTWRDPAIYSQIIAAGQSVSSVSTIEVPAHPSAYPLWTDTGVVLGSNQSIWVDTQAALKWNPCPGFLPAPADANGTFYNPAFMNPAGNYVNLPGYWNALAPNWHEAGFGVSGPGGNFPGFPAIQPQIFQQNSYGSLIGQTPGSLFFAGNTLLDYQPSNIGGIGLMINLSPSCYQTYPGNGYQDVRVIVVNGSPPPPPSPYEND